MYPAPFGSQTGDIVEVSSQCFTLTTQVSGYTGTSEMLLSTNFDSCSQCTDTNVCNTPTPTVTPSVTPSITPSVTTTNTNTPSITRTRTLKRVTTVPLCSGDSSNYNVTTVFYSSSEDPGIGDVGFYDETCFRIFYVFPETALLDVEILGPISFQFSGDSECLSANPCLTPTPTPSVTSTATPTATVSYTPSATTTNTPTSSQTPTPSLTRGLQSYVMRSCCYGDYAFFNGYTNFGLYLKPGGVYWNTLENNCYEVMEVIPYNSNYETTVFGVYDDCETCTNAVVCLTPTPTPTNTETATPTPTTTTSIVLGKLVNVCDNDDVIYYNILNGSSGKTVSVEYDCYTITEVYSYDAPSLPTYYGLYYNTVVQCQNAHGVCPTNTPTNSPTTSVTPTNTPTSSQTHTSTPTNTSTTTQTPTNTPTNSQTVTPTISKSIDQTPDPTSTSTPTPSPSPSEDLHKPPTSTNTTTPTPTPTNTSTVQLLHRQILRHPQIHQQIHQHQQTHQQIHRQIL